MAELPTLASPHLPAVHAASLLSRLCGSGKLTHLLRSAPQSRVQAAARSFDAKVLAAYEKLASLDPLTADQRTQCRLSLRLGSRGLRSSWVGSWSQCLSEVKVRSGLDCLTDLETCDLPFAVACKDALAALSEASGNEEDALPTWLEFAQAPRRAKYRSCLAS